MFEAIDTSVITGAASGGVVMSLIAVIKVLINKMKPEKFTNSLLDTERYDYIKECMLDTKEQVREINRSFNVLVLTQERFLGKVEILIDRTARVADH